MYILYTHNESQQGYIFSVLLRKRVFIFLPEFSLMYSIRGYFVKFSQQKFFRANKGGEGHFI